MADYILTYDIPNEKRADLEEALTKELNAERELGVSTFWLIKGADYPAERLTNALKQVFPGIKAYVYEVNRLNSASTELTRDQLPFLLEALRRGRLK